MSNNAKRSTETIRRICGGKPVRTSGVEEIYHAPYREDKNPSFSLNTEKGVWYDFGIQEGGNATTLIQKMKG